MRIENQLNSLEIRIREIKWKTDTKEKTNDRINYLSNRTYIPGMLKSITSKSTENLDVIRPDGVVEKKEIGAPTINIDS